MHDRGAFGEVSAQPHSRGIGDADTRRNDIVGHARKLVDAIHGEVLPGCPGTNASRIELVKSHRPCACPGNVRQRSKDAIEVDAARRSKPTGQQMQAKVSIGDRCRGLIDVDRHANRSNCHIAQLVTGFT